ncbi:GNAT family N-acetyltransferase [Acinetobacter boissieri]|uniref:Acetyltransferase (GNAT) domain-containing protein n=1 Tax=Acinetobacter boissieri TaxID=1219383 RepID=A0A1G6JK52_9GAMM|nr:GNAT family N-acetyltransferase [Acinetobacter boissieri]SDC19162.1 Acetyltransferase (GNAT) domain-containing protein [Acinetobacter boissieri]
MTLSYRQLFAEKSTDIAQLQSVYNASTDYFQIVLGHLPNNDATHQDLLAVPQGCSLDAKFFYGIYEKTQMIGCIDLIRGYPNENTIFIGLLLFITTRQGLGYGPQSLEFIIQQAIQWNCHQLRIAVVASNVKALAFWLREGFIEIYRKESEKFVAPIVVMERVINATDFQQLKS